MILINSKSPGVKHKQTKETEKCNILSIKLVSRSLGQSVSLRSDKLLRFSLLSRKLIVTVKVHMRIY